jgi:hypothetical protein
LPLLMLFQLVSSSQLSKLTSFDTSGAIVKTFFSPTIMLWLNKLECLSLPIIISLVQYFEPGLKLHSNGRLCALT